MSEFAPPPGPGYPPSRGSGYPPQGPGYSYPPLPVKDGRRLRTVGRVLTVLGAVVLLVAGIGGGVAAYGGFKDTAETFQHQTHVDPSAEVTLGAGDEYQLFYRAGTVSDNGTTTAVSPSHGGTPAQCTVKDPNGESVDLADSDSTTVTTGSTSWQSFVSWTARDAGRYQISCVHDGVLAAPALKAESIVTGVVGVLVAVFGGLGGLALLIAGIVCWVIGSGRDVEGGAVSGVPRGRRPRPRYARSRSCRPPPGHRQACR